jgi:hypothetical protein
MSQKTYPSCTAYHFPGEIAVKAQRAHFREPKFPIAANPQFDGVHLRTNNASQPLVPQKESAMKDTTNRVLLLTGLIALGVVARLLPHPDNFVPLGALALFGGASFADRRLALLVPLLAMLISDLWLGWHSTLPVVYVCLAANVFLGRWAGDRLQVSRLIPAGLAGALVFFVGTNLAFWYAYHPHTLSELLICFGNALPFFRSSLAADMIYGCTLFGALALAQSFQPSFRPAGIRIA